METLFAKDRSLWIYVVESVILSTLLMFTSNPSIETVLTLFMLLVYRVSTMETFFARDTWVLMEVLWWFISSRSITFNVAVFMKRIMLFLPSKA